MKMNYIGVYFFSTAINWFVAWVNDQSRMMKSQKAFDGKNDTFRKDQDVLLNRIIKQSLKYLFNGFSFISFSGFLQSVIEFVQNTIGSIFEVFFYHWITELFLYSVSSTTNNEIENKMEDYRIYVPNDYKYKTLR